MEEKFKAGEFGVCPRVLCNGQNVLPVGVSDIAGLMSVKLFCPNCQDVYFPNSRRYHTIDGAFFGTTFPHLLLQVSDTSVKCKSEVYVPKIFGFKVHHLSQEQEKRDEVRIATQLKRELLMDGKI